MRTLHRVQSYKTAHDDISEHVIQFGNDDAESTSTAYTWTITSNSFEVDASFIDGSLTLSYGDESDVYIGFDASELSKIMVELQSRLDHRADQS